MKRLPLIFLLVLSVMGFAATKSKKESIKELFVLMKQDSILQKSVESMSFVANTGFQPQGNVDSMLVTHRKENLKITLSTIKKLLPKIQEDMIDYYDKYFTDKEIKDFLKFYKSPSGRKLVSTSWLITKDFMESFHSKYMNEILINIIKPLVGPTKKQYINRNFPAPDSSSVAAMKAEYLDINIDATCTSLTDAQKQILMKAIERTNYYAAFDESNGEFTLKVSNAEELNMSERLFAIIKRNMELKNQFV